MRRPDRRRFLQTVGTVTAGGLFAGCQSSENDDSATNETTTTPPDEGKTFDADPTALKERARAFLQLFVEDSFEQAHERLTDRVATELSRERLREEWSTQTEGKGSFEGFDSIVYRERRNGFEVVVELRFQKGRQRAVVVLAPEDVAGFRLSTSEVWTPPAYVDQSAFIERELSLDTPESCSLGATVTMPEGDGQVPGVVLVHGNGSQDRDETIGPNKTFKDIAWGLATDGLAVLRYDKRTHACDVDRADATIDDIVTDDALTAIDRLRGQARVSAVFVAGHSFGGLLAPRIAKRDGTLAGVVMLAPGPARPMADTLVDQMEHLARLDGEVTDAEERRLARTREIAEKIRTLDIADDEVVNTFGGDEFYRSLKEYDHTETAARLDVPRLVIQGGSDWQVTVEDDLSIWRDAIGDQQNVRFEVYPDLNHRFQQSEGKETRREYKDPGSVSEAVVTDIAAFVENNT